MSRNLVLVVLVGAVAAISWLPSVLEPSLDLPWWAPLVVIGLSAGCATALSGGRWVRFLFIAALFTILGVIAEYEIWPMADGIAQSYSGFAALAAGLAVAVVCLATGLIGRILSRVAPRQRLVAWLLLTGCAAFGPTALALRPAVIGWRVSHNDALAAKRFASLKAAAERVEVQQGGSASICDGRSLKRDYSGPPFSERNWRYLAGNYVKEDGYIFGIWIDCSRPSRYIIDTRPARDKADGTKKFCTDQTGKLGCGMDWTGSRNECVPCPH